MLKLTFLGTSSGVPTRYRNVTSLAVRTGPEKDWWMVDCGEATQHQLQRTRLSAHDMAGICITHVHGDHTYGLPGLLASAAMTGRKRPLPIIANRAIHEWLQVTLKLTETFMPFELQFIDVDQAETVYQDSSLHITRHVLSHRAPSMAYRFALSHTRRRLDVPALQALGLKPGPSWKALQNGEPLTLEDGRVLLAADFTIEEHDKLAVIVGGDNDTPGLLQEAAHDAQLLVHESTYTEAMLQKVGAGPTHSSVQRVAEFAQEAGLPNLILTHFSARYHSPEGMQELEAEARAHFQGNLFLASDFDTYCLNAEGVLSREEK